jgi:transposase InsO family protein
VHGVLAPNAKLRREIIVPPVEQEAGASTDCPRVQGEPARLSWARLLKRVLFPYPLQSVLTDNGSGFMKHFDEEIRRLHKTHWHTYPRTPKMNAHVERFNRTIQEEFIDYHEQLLTSPDQFNRQLVPWLLWYNAERPQWALQLKFPLQFLLKENPALCNSWWPDTRN